MKFKLLLVLSCLFTAPMLHAQVTGDGGTVRGMEYFEGSISYHVGVSGPEAENLKELNDIVQMTWHLKDADYIIQQTPSMAAMQKRDGNYMFMTRLFIADSNRLYTLDLEGRRCFKRERGINYRPERPPVAVDMNDSAKVMGVMCYLYKVEKDGQTTVYYISPKYRMNTALFKGKTQARISFLTQGLNGCIPLKTVITTPGYKATVTANKIVPRKLSVADFRIPPGFEISSFDYRR